MSTSSGKSASQSYNDNIRQQNIRWAMVDQLKNPSRGFEEVIRNHFCLKKDIVVEEILGWIKESSKSQADTLEKLLEEFKKEVEKIQ